MTTSTTPVKSATALLASTSVAAGTPNRQVMDMRTMMGGLLTGKFTNGATGPTVQCVATLLVAPTTSSTPAAAAAGTDWKVLAVVGASGTVNSDVKPFSYRIPTWVCHIEIEFAGNTGQAVQCEAQVQALDSLLNT